MSPKPILRFAPSPNGLLHLGHAYSALLTAGLAQALDGTMLLRIEDIDLQRSKPEFVAAIFEDLHWLGLDWPEPVLRQSERFAVYAQASETLKQMDLLYPCFCTRAEVAATAVGTDPDGAPRYGGACRGLDSGEAAARLAAGAPAQWRVKLDAAKRVAGPSFVHEHERIITQGERVFLGPARTRSAEPSTWGDVVIVRKDTPTSYHLSVVVDDAAQGVTHVTRGMDLYHATDLQVLLQKLLALPSPVYAHHGLVVDEGDRKLSKSRGSPSLASLRAVGWRPEDVRRRLGLRA